jgi:hypothetical protein
MRRMVVTVSALFAVMAWKEYEGVIQAGRGID